MKTSITDNLLPVVTPLMVTLADIKDWVTILAGLATTVAAIITSIKMLGEMKKK